MKRIKLSMVFMEDDSINCSIEIDTASGCKVNMEAGSLWPSDLQMLEEVVKALRAGKDVYTPQRTPKQE